MVGIALGFSAKLFHVFRRAVPHTCKTLTIYLLHILRLLAVVHMIALSCRPIIPATTSKPSVPVVSRQAMHNCDTRHNLSQPSTGFPQALRELKGCSAKDGIKLFIASRAANIAVKKMGLNLCSLVPLSCSHMPAEERDGSAFGCSFCS